MRRRYRELWYALVAMLAITAAYVVAYRQAGDFPAAYGLVGHGIGVAGFLLMLMTETLYSVRKQLTDSRWGSMAGWLRFHMVTGLVGPYLVLLHTSMRFRGLAGLVMLLSLVVAVSGLVGRYLYTAVPRAIEGLEPASVPALALGAAAAGTDAPGGMAKQVVERRGLDRRLRRLSVERHTLATWRSLHVPLTWALFVLAFVHVVAAVYYATLLR